MTEDKSYGVVVFHNKKFLLLKHKKGHWGFPKGHKEGNETNEETALRELKEETGITNCAFLNHSPISEEYFLTEEGKSDWHKVVQYFIGTVESSEIVIQESEIVEYRWVLYEEALAMLAHRVTREVLNKAKHILIQNKCAP